MTLHSVRRLALGDLEGELAAARKVLERVPFDRDDWTPHARSFTVRQLAAHCATLPWWGIGIVRQDAFDLAAATPPRPPLPTTSDELLQRFDQHRGDLLAALDGASDQHLVESWTLRRGDAVIAVMPRCAAIRRFLLSHLVHHRGQLTVYLRLLDRPVPGLYGPSADEP